MEDIYRLILDFVSNWHGISHHVSIEQDKVTVVTYNDDFNVVFNDFKNAKEAIEFIIKVYGWPNKSDILREAKVTAEEIIDRNNLF